MNQNTYATQDSLMLSKLLNFYKNIDYLEKMLDIINGNSKISLRIMDWFSTNYAKKYYTLYDIDKNGETKRFKVYMDYKLKLNAYSKRRFDPFCRWDRIVIPYKDNMSIQTTIGQLNFFKWAIENKVIEYVEKNYSHIERDMNERNSTSKRRTPSNQSGKKIGLKQQKTRKKREELSISAAKTIKKEDVEIIVKFN